jgi:hypothetical protein
MSSWVVAQHNYSFVNRTVAWVVLWLRRLVASLPPRRPGHHPRPAHVAFMTLERDFLRVFHSTTVPYSFIYLSQTVCNLGSWQRHWIKKTHTHTHTHTCTVVKQRNSFGHYVHRLTTYSWYLSPSTLHSAVIGTGQALLGSPRIGQATLRLFQNIYCLWQCDTLRILSFLFLLWITLLEYHFSSTTLYISSIILSPLTDFSTDEVLYFRNSDIKLSVHT